MIHEIIDVTRAELNSHVRDVVPNSEQSADLVQFTELRGVEPQIQLEAVNVLLINIEEERALKMADPYVQALPNGDVVPVQAPVSLNLHLLFAACFKDYKKGVRHLSAIIQYLQQHPVMDPQRFPALPEGVSKLTFELQSLTPNQQNEIWGMLKLAYLPSVVYKVRMVTYQTDFAPGGAEVREVNLNAGGR